MAPKPYYEQDGRDKNGRFRPGVSTPKSAEHRRRIGEAQKRAWGAKRQRLPIGSTRIDRDGYRRVKVVFGSGRWELEHVLVVEQVIGRKLHASEVVHHINGNRLDNNASNLFVCKDRSHHNDVHRSQDVAFRKLLESGLVTFKDGVYEAVL